MKKWLTITANATSNESEINIDGIIGGGGWFEDPGVRAADIKAELKEIAAIKGDVIRVNINSLGGDINDGMSIHDLLAQNPAKKIVYINGMTASAATVIAMAGDEINMSENALFLVHRGSTYAGGNLNDIKMVLGDLEKIDTLMSVLYSKKTGKTPEEVLAKMDVNNGNGEWMTAQEAKEFGFVTNTFEPTKIAAVASRKMFAHLHIPYPEEKINSSNIITTQMKKSIVAIVKELFTGSGIKFEETAAKKGIDINTDKGVLHIDTEDTEAKVGDTATMDGAPAPAGEYIVTDTQNTITIDDTGKITEIATEEEEQSEDTEALKTEISSLKEKLNVANKRNAELSAQITEESDNEKTVIANVEALTKQYQILAKSIESSGFELPKEVTIFTKKKTEVAAGTEASERRKNYKTQK